MKLTTPYIPLALSRPFDKAPAPVTSWGRRRALRTTILLVLGFATYFLYQHIHYSSTNPDLAQDYTSEDLDSVEPADLSLDTIYLPFRPQPPARNRRVKAGLQLPQECLDAHFSEGKLCYAGVEKMDVLWTWVNGSDILLQNAKARITASYRSNDPNKPYGSWKQQRQFRDHDELRYSVRSVLANFRSHVGTLHLLTNDVEFPSVGNSTSSSGLRLGQIPQWLNVAHRPWRDGAVELSAMHHAQIFDPYPDNTFNSYAVESQFGHLEDISENFIYLNDDFFFLKQVTPRTFYTSAYGMVLRMQSDMGVSPTQYGNNIKGEWRALAASNSLLSQRFGKRQRPYVLHEAKAGSISLLHEMGLMWSSQFRETATHPFRETVSGNADPSMMFMLAHFTVERWREALLWSFIVGKHGTLDDRWTRHSLEGAWKDLGGLDSNPILPVKGVFRDTLVDTDARLKESGHVDPDPTTYEFSSQDGYPYLNFRGGFKNKWPHYTRESTAHLPECTIRYDECFKNSRGREFSRASELFKHVAFEKMQCGDCMTLALVAASGASGLEAFLPSPDKTVASSALAGKIPFLAPAPDEDEGPVPHLPLADKWEDAKFALRDVVTPWGAAGPREKNVRGWTLRVLERYRFVIGNTPSHFAMLTSPSDVANLARKFGAKSAARTDTALLCVNDDVVIDDEKVARLFKSWAGERWGTKAAWEV